MRVHGIVWMPLVPFVCQTCQWVSTAATSTLNQASHLLLAPAAGLGCDTALDGDDDWTAVSDGKPDIDWRNQDQRNRIDRSWCQPPNDQRRGRLHATKEQSPEDGGLDRVLPGSSVGRGTILSYICMHCCFSVESGGPLSAPFCPIIIWFSIAGGE